MQTLSLKDAATYTKDSIAKTYQEAAYIGWLRLDPNSDTIHETLPELKLNPSGFYDMAKLIASGYPIKHILNSPWGRTLKGRSALLEYMTAPANSPLSAMVTQCKAAKQSGGALYFLEQLKAQCNKPMPTKQVNEILAGIDEIKNILKSASDFI